MRLNPRFKKREEKERFEKTMMNLKASYISKVGNFNKSKKLKNKTKKRNLKLWSLEVFVDLMMRGR